MNGDFKVKRLEYSILKGKIRIEEAADLYNKVFLDDEPTNKWFTDLGINYDEECLRSIKADLMKKMSQGHSVAAIDPVTDKVVAGRISFKFNRFNTEQLFAVDEHLKNHFRWKMDSILHDHCCDLGRIFKFFPQVKEVMFFHSLFVLPDYRRMGIAKELVNRSLEIAKKSGCDCIVVFATSDATKIIFDKLGFIRVYTTYYDDLDLSGLPMDPSQYSGMSASTYILLL